MGQLWEKDGESEEKEEGGRRVTLSGGALLAASQGRAPETARSRAGRARPCALGPELRCVPFRATWACSRPQGAGAAAGDGGGGGALSSEVGALGAKGLVLSNRWFRY